MGSPHPGKYLQQVEDDAKRATFIVQKLTSPKEEMRASLPSGTEPMPISELHFCHGLAFTFVRKGGIGLSFEHGHGFVIAKLPGDSTDPNRPSWKWSAPLFVECFAGGLGLTLGYTEIDSTIVLDTTQAVHAFANTQVMLDTDITSAFGKDVGTHLPATAANVTNIRLSDKTFTYSICKGVMVDVSLTGMGYSVDSSMNHALYGPDVTPQAVLEGAVQAPPSMQELYDALDRGLRSYYAYAHEAGAAANARPPVTATEAAGPPVTAEPVQTEPAA